MFGTKDGRTTIWTNRVTTKARILYPLLNLSSQSIGRGPFVLRHHPLDRAFGDLGDLFGEAVGELGGETVVIYAACVNDHVAGLAKDTDLSKFILYAVSRTTPPRTLVIQARPQFGEGDRDVRLIGGAFA